MDLMLNNLQRLIYHKTQTTNQLIPEEIVLGKQGITGYKRITLRKGGEGIQTKTYILTFNKFIIPKEIKVE